MTERLTAAQFKATRKKPRDVEGPIQRAIVAYLRRVLPVANIVTSIEAKRYSAKEGARFKAQGQLPGMPDLMVLTYLGPLFFEVKAEGGRVSPIQKAMHKKMRAMGYRVAVVRSVQDVKDCLSEWCVHTNEPVAEIELRGVVK